MATTGRRTGLRDRLLDRIEEHGPITFAAFMESALYDPAEGFYARPAVGRHFVTSPHVSPAFGALLARQVAEVWDRLGRPGRMTVAEVGAGDGTLAGRILEGAGSNPMLAAALRYIALERTSAAREALAERGLEVAERVGALGPITGCVLANEVLDNVPFHRLRERDGRVVEVLVGADGRRLVEVEGRPSPAVLEALGPPLRPGEERPVSPDAVAMVREVAGSLERGYAFFLDYGYGAGETPGPVHGYRDHRVLEDVLDDPGSRDVTAGVDLQAVAEEGRRAGLQVWGPVPQREALLALGFRLWLSGVRARQADAERHGDWRTATRLYAERSRATILIDPQKLGGLRLVAMGTEGLPPPAAVLGDGETGC